MEFLNAALEQAAMLEQWTLCTVEDVPDNEWTEQPGGLRNHPAWILGHLVYAMDNVTKALGGEVSRDDTWSEPYATNSAPSGARDAYPSREQLLDAFRDSSASLRKTLASVDASRLAEPVGVPELAMFFPTFGRWVAHVLLAEGAFHTGQLSAWRQAKGLSSVFVEANVPRMVASALTV